MLLKPLSDWHEDDGPAVFYGIILGGEPPVVYCGTPNSSDWPAWSAQHDLWWWHPIPDEVNALIAARPPVAS